MIRTLCVDRRGDWRRLRDDATDYRGLSGDQGVRGPRHIRPAGDAEVYDDDNRVSSGGQLRHLRQSPWRREIDNDQVGAAALSKAIHLLT